MLKAVDSASNFIRAIVSLVVVGVASVAGWMGYATYYEKDLAIRQNEAKIDALEAELAEKKQEIERLDTAVRLLKLDRRVAQVDCIDKQVAANGTVKTTFTFVEFDREGKPLETPRPFTIDGDIVHIDALVVKFLDEHVEQGDPVRGATMFLFRRIHGESQAPDQAFMLDKAGDRPAAYSQGSQMSDDERAIWSRFWEYAADLEKAEKDGVRAAHGQTNYTRLLKGKRYKVVLRASDGISITQDGDVPPDAGRSAL